MTSQGKLQPTRTKPLYCFWFKFQPYGEKVESGLRECHKPERTNIYKRLRRNFEEGFICSYGYTEIKIKL